MLAEPAADLLDLLEEYAANLRRVGHVNAKGLLLPNAFGFAIGDDGAIVDAVRQLQEMVGVAAEPALERFGGVLTQIADLMDTERLQSLSGDGADAPELVYRQREQQRID